MNEIKGYVDGILFITSNNNSLVRYTLEQELKLNSATKISYHIPGIIYGDYEYIGNEWVCNRT